MDPWTPLSFGFNTERTPGTCISCKIPDGIPATATVRLTDRHGKPVCTDCARKHEPAAAALAHNLEALRQQLLAHHDADVDLYCAADYLRGLADEIESLRAHRDVVNTSTPTTDGVTSHYDTRPRGQTP